MPKLPSRPKLISLRLTELEHDLVMHLAQQNGMNASSMLRHAILHHAKTVGKMAEPLGTMHSNRIYAASQAREDAL